MCSEQKGYFNVLMSIVVHEVHCICNRPRYSICAGIVNVGEAHYIHGTSAIMYTGDVKEFGFRSIPEDGNYASHFSGDTSTPKADAGDQTSFSDSRPANSDSDLIDLGQGPSEEGSDQRAAGVDRGAVEKAISDADSASNQRHPHLHQRHQQHQQHQQGELSVEVQRALLNRKMVTQIPAGILF